MPKHTSTRQKERLIIGLMSGTSLDGLDIALCHFTGSNIHTKCSLLKFITIPYPEKVKARIRNVFAKPTVQFLEVATLHAFLGDLHGTYVRKALDKWKVNPDTITCIASHGQTVFHAPRFLFTRADRNSTLQLGDGDHLALKTGIPTISDFRQKHVAAGGEGAPLAVYGDFILFSKKGEDRLMLNMGGIANFTFLPGTIDAKKVFVTDTGPGNTLLDQAVQKFKKGHFYDKNAGFAQRGTIQPPLLKALKSDGFFKRPFPKTIGPELFNLDFVKAAQAASNTQTISFFDLMATLTAFSAETIADAVLKKTGSKSCTIFLSGGGAHNPLLVAGIKSRLAHCTFAPIETLGISGDAKEAVLFATLANETLSASVIDFGKDSKIPSITMGKISLPY